MRFRKPGNQREFKVVKPIAVAGEEAASAPDPRPTTAGEATARPAPGTAEPKRPSQSFYSRSWQQFRRDRTSIVAVVVFGVICLLALGAPVITEALGIDPNRQDLLARFRPPGPGSWLGTDEFGRDQLARILYGARVSLGIGFVVAAISIVLGVLVGLWAGFYAGVVDDVINAAIQFQRAIPLLFVLITVAAVFGPPSPLFLAVLLGIWSWTGAVRLVRGMTLSVKRRDYVDASRSIGASDRRLIFNHIFPNVTSIVLVIAGFDIAGAILAEAGISFLGFGIQPPTASWGNMLTNSLEYVRRAWWLVAAPGIAISITVLCVLLIADGLRDAFDPRLR